MFSIFMVLWELVPRILQPSTKMKNCSKTPQVAAMLGNVPWIIVGDFQTNPSESPTLGALCANKHVYDLGEIFTNSAWTFQKGDNTNIRTRIDLAMCSSTMLSHILDVTILRDTNLPGHCPISISLDFPAYVDTKHVYRSPKAFPKSICAVNSEQAQAFDVQAWNAASDDFDEAVQRGDVDAAFQVWTRTAEKFCVLLVNASNDTCSRKSLGRGQPAKVIQQPLSAAPAAPHIGAATHRLSSLAKLQRKLVQLKAKLHAKPVAGSSHHKQLNNLQINIHQSWLRIFGTTLDKHDLASIDRIQILCSQIKTETTNEQVIISEKRLDTFKQKLIRDWQSNRTQTYAWIRDQPPLTTPCFQTCEKQYVTKHAELHKMMIEAWGPIFNRYDKINPPSYSEFCQQFPFALPVDCQYNAQNPFVLPEISPEDLQAIICKLQPSSPGIDFWQTHELQSLGPRSIGKLASLFQLIENMQQWPSSLLEVPVAALKKHSGLTPLENRPIALTSQLYRVWAKLRWAQLQEWYLQWIPDELKGGIAGRQTIDSYFEVALELEHAQFNNHPVFGILYDYEKCFDNVAWSIEQGLLQDLGMPTQTMGAMFSYNQNIRRRFKFGNSVGPAFKNTNSICQGCPLAILRINALIAAWVRVVKNNPDGLCRTNAFIDDRNLRASSLSDLQKGINITDQFDKAIDAIPNTSKTVVFATSLNARQQVHCCGYKVVTFDKLLGYNLAFTKRRSTQMMDQRAQAYTSVARRIAMCPLSLDAREILLTSAGASKFTYGLEIGSCQKKLEKSLRSAVVKALWTKDQHKSVDILLSLCHKGHNFDPFQLKLSQPLKLVRRQLVKHPQLRPQFIHC